MSMRGSKQHQGSGDILIYIIHERERERVKKRKEKPVKVCEMGVSSFLIAPSGVGKRPNLDEKISKEKTN